MPHRDVGHLLLDLVLGLDDLVRLELAGAALALGLDPGGVPAVRISCLLRAACESEFHCVRYCWNTRAGAASPFDFSYVMPAAPNAVAGTVSP